jgi:hypothetical protein
MLIENYKLNKLMLNLKMAKASLHLSPVNALAVQMLFEKLERVNGPYDKIRQEIQMRYSKANEETKQMEITDPQGLMDELSPIAYDKAELDTDSFKLELPATTKVSVELIGSFRDVF